MERTKKLYFALGLSALPASLVIFVSSNFVNVGNLLFNLVFSRWMGPEMFSDLAFLLTLKLSILGVLNAVQMLVTERVAHENERRDEAIARYARLSKSAMLIVFFMVPVLAVIVHYAGFQQLFGLASPWYMIVFVLGVPFYLPLALWRGVAQGQVDLFRMVASANVEMLVRLVGGALLYALGFGVVGVLVAFIASLVAAWYFAKSPAPNTEPMPRKEALPFKQALPWAAMQLSMILALEGDVFVAKSTMASLDAGYVAALALVQRIVFYASFAMTTIALPQVISEVKAGGSGMRAMKPILGIYLLATLPVLIACWIMPEFGVRLLFGEEYLFIADHLLKAAASAGIVTLVYLIITFLVALKVYKSTLVYFVLSVSQIVVLTLLQKLAQSGVAEIVNQKFVIQLFILGVVLMMGYSELKRKGVAK